MLRLDKESAHTPRSSVAAYEGKRSKGYEGMAVSPDGRYLYPLLEGPLYVSNGTAKAYEKTPAGKEYLRILQV